MTVSDNPPAAPAVPTERVRLDFLDGLRGIAAFYVATYHAWLYAGHNGARDYSIPFRCLQKIVGYGHYSVAVFIVLSGFVLGVPVAQTANKTLKGGFLGYIKRRAWRILPPYYAALLFFLLLIAALPILQHSQNTAWDSKIPITTGTVVSHLLLVHNLRGDWSLKIDGPLWSVATEWQIYFLYPAILLPVWRRFGFATMAGVGFLLGLGVRLLSKFVPMLDLNGAAPQYIGLFAVGAAASAVAFSQEAFAARVRERVPWKAVSLVAVVVLIAAHSVRGGALEGMRWAGDTLVGSVVAILILNCTLRLQRGQSASPLLRWLSSPLALWLGLFSYSIYLIHSPLLGLFNLLTLSVKLSDDARLAMMLVVAVPLAIGASYLFHLLVERHFLTGHQQKLKGALASQQQGA